MNCLLPQPSLNQNKRKCPHTYSKNVTSMNTNLKEIHCTGTYFEGAIKGKDIIQEYIFFSGKFSLKVFDLWITFGYRDNIHKIQEKSQGLNPEGLKQTDNSSWEKADFYSEWQITDVMLRHATGTCLMNLHEGFPFYGRMRSMRITVNDRGFVD